MPVIRISMIESMLSRRDTPVAPRRSSARTPLIFAPMYVVVNVCGGIVCINR